MNREELLKNIDSIHTTDKGIDRIKKNLNIDYDVISYCKDLILDSNCVVTKKGKNYYCENQSILITIHSKSFTIITGHKK